eukprot:jgi/Bigna1/76349/fgenesh1_pg.40_\
MRAQLVQLASCAACASVGAHTRTGRQPRALVLPDRTSEASDDLRFPPCVNVACPPRVVLRLVSLQRPTVAILLLRQKLSISSQCVNDCDFLTDDVSCCDFLPATSTPSFRGSDALGFARARPAMSTEWGEEDDTGTWVGEEADVAWSNNAKSKTGQEPEEERARQQPNNSSQVSKNPFFEWSWANRKNKSSHRKQRSVAKATKGVLEEDEGEERQGAQRQRKRPRFAADYGHEKETYSSPPPSFSSGMLKKQRTVIFTSATDPNVVDDEDATQQQPTQPQESSPSVIPKREEGVSKDGGGGRDTNQDVVIKRLEREVEELQRELSDLTAELQAAEEEEGRLVKQKEKEGEGEGGGDQEEESFPDKTPSSTASPIGNESSLLLHQASTNRKSSHLCKLDASGDDDDDNGKRNQRNQIPNRMHDKGGGGGELRGKDREEMKKTVIKTKEGGPERKMRVEIADANPEEDRKKERRTAIKYVEKRRKKSMEEDREEEDSMQQELEEKENCEADFDDRATQECETQRQQKGRRSSSTKTEDDSTTELNDYSDDDITIELDDYSDDVDDDGKKANMNDSDNKQDARKPRKTRCKNMSKEREVEKENGAMKKQETYIRLKSNALVEVAAKVKNMKICKREIFKATQLITVMKEEDEGAATKSSKKKTESRDKAIRVGKEVRMTSKDERIINIEKRKERERAVEEEEEPGEDSRRQKMQRLMATTRFDKSSVTTQGGGCNEARWQQSTRRRKQQMFEISNNTREHVGPAPKQQQPTQRKKLVALRQLADDDDEQDNEYRPNDNGTDSASITTTTTIPGSAAVPLPASFEKKGRNSNSMSSGSHVDEQARGGGQDRDFTGVPMGVEEVVKECPLGGGCGRPVSTKRMSLVDIFLQLSIRVRYR